MSYIVMKNEGIKTFGLEERLFLAFSIIAISASLLASMINLFLELWIPLIIAFSVLLAQGFIYYLVRYRGWFKAGVIASIIIVNLLLAVNFFFNAGLAGPSLLYLCATFYFSVTVAPMRHTVFWLLANMVLVGVLGLLSYSNPDLVVSYYEDSQGYLIDMLLSYYVIVAIIFVGTIYIRRLNKKQNVEIQEKAKDLEVINKEKDKLFSIISHDLRSPLANVQTYLQSLNEIDLSAQEREGMEKDLLDATKSTLELLNNLLAWSQNQMGRANPVIREFNLKKKTLQTIDPMVLAAANKDIALKVDIPDDVTVYADENMLNLVIRNLLSNAIKFTFSKGWIEISARQSETGDCTIRVADNGKGIVLEEQAEVFSINMASKSGTRQEKGTGLGLMLCKEYMDKQNGKIHFQSAPGQGSVFFLSFPAYKKGQLN